MNREDRLSSFSLSLGLLLLLRVRLHCCHVRLPRPRPGHSLRRGEHLGLVGPAKLEADLAGVMTVTWAIGSYTNVSFRSSAADGSCSHHRTVIACSPTASPTEIGILVFSRALARAVSHTCTCLYAKRTARDAGIARVS